MAFKTNNHVASWVKNLFHSKLPFKHRKKITKTKPPNCPKSHTLKPLKIISNFELYTGEK